MLQLSKEYDRILQAPKHVYAKCKWKLTGLPNFIGASGWMTFNLSLVII